ncbi:MAG: hypothetical protein ACFFBP_00520 [Promethearchaeota archaeon]
MINYLIKTNDLIKIFADFYYVKGKKESISKNYKNNHTVVELVSKVLKMMDFKEWYFGLHTALRLYDISLQENPTECLITTRMPFNRKNIIVLGKNLQVFIFNQELFTFYKMKNGIKYSDLEKTFLDFLYLWKSNHVPDHKIFRILGKYRDQISQEKIMRYSAIYPSNIQQVLKDFFN